MTLTFPLAFLACLAVVSITTTLGAGDEGLYVNITILQKATAEGAVCLDGNPPAYHLHPGHGSGLNSWIIVLDVSYYCLLNYLLFTLLIRGKFHIYRLARGWCSSIPDCLHRSANYSGSSKYTDHRAYFAGILSNISEENPEFYNWNRVRVKYCDGSSFTGDVEQVDPDNKLYFRGSRIFKAIMEDLWSKGMQNAENAILSGSSAGGLATILNCDKFKSLLTNDARVKCVADGGFFINGRTISGTLHIQEIYENVVALHGSAKNLPSACTSTMEPSLCFFPQNVVPYIQTPLFIINSAYDSWQINNILVPEYLDPQRVWDPCKKQISNCTFSQRLIIQAFGVEFLKVFEGLPPCFTRGYFITSCHSHGAILSTNFWFSPTSPRLLHKTLAEAVADWYFDRSGFKHIDPYPCARDCK